MSRPPRPLGITIIAVLEIIEGLILLLGGLTLTALGSIFGELFTTYGRILGALGGLVGGVLIIIAIINFVVAYGLLTGANWARIMGLIFGALGILRGLLTLPFGLLALILNALLVYYLTRSRVMRFFRA